MSTKTNVTYTYTYNKYQITGRELNGKGIPFFFCVQDSNYTTEQFKHAYALQQRQDSLLSVVQLCRLQMVDR